MDFVYVCRNGDNEELRYSIRSVYHSFPDAKIWVVGGKPKWYTGNYIETPQNKNKFSNVLGSLRRVCATDEISDTFILMNDDFFIINKIDKIPVLHGGYLSERVESLIDLTPQSAYLKLLKLTSFRLSRMGHHDALDYDIHVPMQMQKSRMSRSLQKGVLWRSMYGNLNRVGGISIKDVKIYRDDDILNKIINGDTNDMNFISTIDDRFEEIEGYLKARFPNKSPLEA